MRERLIHWDILGKRAKILMEREGGRGDERTRERRGYEGDVMNQV